MLIFRKASLLASLLLLVLFSHAQNPPEITTTRAVFKKTAPLRDIIKNGGSTQTVITRDLNGLVGTVKKTAIIHPFEEQDRPAIVDPVLQAPPGSERIEAASATVSPNFNGLPFTSVAPADPVSVTGPNHVIQMINNSSSSLVRIVDKTGVAVIPDFVFSTITGVTGAGDPIVQYDAVANRWILNEFGRTPTGSTYINTLIYAISATPDPTGAWYIYSFVDNFFVDYQKVAVWHNAYYATSNDFNTAGTAYLGSSIYAYEKAKMLVGDPSAVCIRVRMTDPGGRYFSMAPVTQEGTSASTLSGQFAFYQNDVYTSDPSDVDSLFTFTFTPNFITPASSVISAFTRMEIAPIDDDLCPTARDACIPQQGTAVTLEGLTGRIMNKINFRKFPAYESMVLCMTVDADGAGKAGIRWMELRRTAGEWSLFQQGTYSPDATHRFMPSICQDALGNIALVYNSSGTTSFPSLRITARNPCDPFGTMTLPEQIIIAGTAAQTFNAWYGDYNSLSIDPSDNLKFWLTGMYNATGNWSTRLAGFTLNDCAPQPKVRFLNSALVTAESAANTVSGCLKYKDYVVNMVIDVAPSADATATFNIAGVPTATAGVDYTISPASVVLNSSNLSAPITIRVFDDAAFEGTESFTVGYTLNNNGGTALVGDVNQTCVVTINDNDALPVIGSSGSFSVGTYNANIASQSPFRSNQSKFRIQNLWTASELIAAGITSARNFTSMTMNVVTKNSTVPYTNFTISMANTAATTLATGFQAGSFTTVYPATNYSTVAGTNLLTFTTPFAWDGTSNILIDFCFDNAAAEGLADVTEGTATAIGTGIRASTYSNGLVATPCVGAAAFISDARIRATFGTNIPTTIVATTVTSKIAYLGPNDDVPFYDATGRILARVKNLTAWDYGCTTVEVDRAGTGSTAFWNNNAANHLTNKTFRITPTNANASGQYEITLYYTAAEKTGYESATGQSWSGIQMIKTVGPINGITPATPLPSTVTINSVLTPGTFGSDFTLKGTFTNGFSGFAVGKPGNVLPVSLLSFNGRKNNTVVDLDWKTSFEQDNSRFEVETSKDATNFYRIGTVTSKGNSSSEQQYAFTDNLPINGINYYRLKQIDLDARNSYSRTITVVFDKKGKDITIYPNPAKDKLTVGFVKPADNVILQIIAADGKIVKTEKAGFVQRNYEISIDKLTPGSYILHITTGNEKYTIKFVKE